MTDVYTLVRKKDRKRPIYYRKTERKKNTDIKKERKKKIGIQTEREKERKGLILRKKKNNEKNW